MQLHLKHWKSLLLNAHVLGGEKDGDSVYSQIEERLRLSKKETDDTVRLDLILSLLEQRKRVS
jgi:hypothetical protein